MQNLKTVDFGVAFTLTRPAPADYEDADGNTQTAAANEPRFNYSNGVAQGLLLDASLSETAAIDDVPAFNASAGHWIIDAEFYNSEPLKGMGLDEVFVGSGKMVVSYSGGTAKVWAGGQAIHTVASYTPVEPTHICEGGMATIAGLTYKPSAISDVDAAALATGEFSAGPYDPLTLFSEGQQGVWYDPSDLTTLFQDAAGTTPVTAGGDPVGNNDDRSPNNNDATQSVSADRPTYNTDGSVHHLAFDGAGDSLRTANFGLPHLHSVSVAFYPTAYPGFIIDGLAPNSGSLVIMPSSTEQAGRVRVYAGRGALYSSQPVALNAWNIVTAIFDGPNSEVRLNGVSVTGDSGTAAPGGVTLGRPGSSTINPLNGRIAGVVVRSGRFTADEITNVEYYLNDLVGGGVL